MKKYLLIMSIITSLLLLTGCQNSIQDRGATKACMHECQQLAKYEDQLKASKPEGYHIVAATCRTDITNEEINKIYRDLGYNASSQQKTSCPNDAVCDCIFEDNTSTTSLLLETIQINKKTVNTTS